MRQSFLTLAAAAVLGLMLTAGEASACHKKKCATPVVCAPAPAPAPVPPPAPVVETCAPAKKHCGGKKLFGHHKKQAVVCAAPMVYETAAPAYSAPMTYAAPQTYATPQAYASGQGS